VALTQLGIKIRALFALLAMRVLQHPHPRKQPVVREHTERLITQITTGFVLPAQLEVIVPIPTILQSHVRLAAIPNLARSLAPHVRQDHFVQIP